MARKPVVSRAVNVTVGLALCVDISREKTVDLRFCVYGHWPEKKLLYQVQKVYGSETLKVNRIKSFSHCVRTYSIDIQEYVDLGERLGKYEEEG